MEVYAPTHLDRNRANVGVTECHRLPSPALNTSYLAARLVLSNYQRPKPRLTHAFGVQRMETREHIVTVSGRF